MAHLKNVFLACWADRDGHRPKRRPILYKVRDSAYSFINEGNRRAHITGAKLAEVNAMSSAELKGKFQDRRRFQEISNFIDILELVKAHSIGLDLPFEERRILKCCF